MPKEGPTLDDLRRSLGRGEFAPVYLFHGEEDYLAETAANLVIAAALAPEDHAFNLDIAFGPESDAREIVAHASAFPMNARRRVVVVREAEKLPNRELLSPYLESPSESTCLVLQTGKVDMRRKPFVSARRHGVVIECRPLYDNQIPGWIVEQVSAAGAAIDQPAARLLASYTGASLREIRSEIEKLLIFAGDRKALTSDDVSAVAGASREFTVFELQKAIGLRNPGRSYQILHRMLEAGESPVRIVTMLTRFYTILWRIHDMRRRGIPPAEQASALGFPPFVMRESEEAVERHPLETVESAFSALLLADEQLKSAPTDPAIVMDVLLTSLLGIPFLQNRPENEKST